MRQQSRRTTRPVQGRKNSKEAPVVSDGIAIVENQGVIEIHIDRPDKKNALTADMYRAMTAALADASARDEIGAVLFAGKGDAFCAGNDLNDFMRSAERRLGKECVSKCISRWSP